MQLTYKLVPESWYGCTARPTVRAISQLCHLHVFFSGRIKLELFCQRHFCVCNLLCRQCGAPHSYRPRYLVAALSDPHRFMFVCLLLRSTCRGRRKCDTSVCPGWRHMYFYCIHLAVDLSVYVRTNWLRGLSSSSNVLKLITLIHRYVSG
jgi:hypothetical protein